MRQTLTRLISFGSPLVAPQARVLLAGRKRASSSPRKGSGRSATRERRCRRLGWRSVQAPRAVKRQVSQTLSRMLRPDPHLISLTHEHSKLLPCFDFPCRAPSARDSSPDTSQPAPPPAHAQARQRRHSSTTCEFGGGIANPHVSKLRCPYGTRVTRRIKEEQRGATSPRPCSRALRRRRFLHQVLYCLPVDEQATYNMNAAAATEP